MGKDVVATNLSCDCAQLQLSHTPRSPHFVPALTVIEIEEKRAHVLVIHLPSPISLVLSDDLAAVLGDELVLLRRVLEEDAPAGDVRGGHQQVLVEAALHRDVLTLDLLHLRERD